MPTDLTQHDEDRDERDLNRIADERMTNPSPGTPIEDVLRETLDRTE